jgi:hypothetical protein
MKIKIIYKIGNSIFINEITEKNYGYQMIELEPHRGSYKQYAESISHIIRDYLNKNTDQQEVSIYVMENE